MTKIFRWKIFPLFAILLLISWAPACAQSSSDNIARHDTSQIAPAGPSVTSVLTSVQESSRYRNSPLPIVRGYGESNPGEKFPFQLYVTPEDQVIEALAAQVNEAEDAYRVAVQWTYVSEQKLNHVADRWLTPHEFLTSTPYYPSNPLRGEEVSDCEEQANTLASLIRAAGIRPEEVRVALGEVIFNDTETGHAWVELFANGHWVALDPSSGPYWHDKARKQVRRRGVPFDYYASHIYPVLQVWAYYNDIYYLDPRDGSGIAPTSWHQVVSDK